MNDDHEQIGQKSIWIIQPYVPTYRVAFFEHLADRLRRQGIDLHVAAGSPTGEQAERGDSVRPDWLVPIATRKIGPAVLSLAWPHYRHSEAVIFPHQGTWLELNVLLFFRRFIFRSGRVGVWGHIASYIADANCLDAAIERWQLRRTDRVLAYTDGGAEYARAVGLDQSQITVLANSIDTGELEAALDSIESEEVKQFQFRFDLDPKSTVAYIGGLDKSKRVDILVEALEDLWDEDPSIRVLIGGRGADSGLLEFAEKRGQVILLGYVGPREKALIARTARLLVNPGRVGLIAVDALLMGLPIVTASRKYHAPEIEYLTEGETLFFSAETGLDLARTICSLLREPPSKSAVQKLPTLDNFVSNYVRAVEEILR
ncbi:glycosyltransferase family 4 protein [Mycolicibacterium neoaurum]|uniref:Glycosyl transferase n=1 Tax=Mycolicibacterium neoaurum TaxID=1795 RepID=A0AAV2WRX5_MYCNE|nr:glycosyltransferase family 4 protein [Mycolicibacterium neoaurum]TLH59058.1 hypothetical protein C1S81_13330 [Mycolicibacterium neoaurum]CDQ46942.1 putative glycosyl transferase [Mycolicibacterium neoaurum]